MKTVYYILDPAGGVTDTDIIMSEHGFFLNRNTACAMLGKLQTEFPEDFRRCKIKAAQLIEN